MSSKLNKDLTKASKGDKKLGLPTALSREALLAKSQLMAKRSIEAKQGGYETDCQLWAANALELLAKTQLSGIHPSLIVEADNTNSLLEANGISTGTAVRTITAGVAYTRLKHTVPNFSTPVVEESKKLAERRNTELHSGDAACAAMPYDAWEGDFWNAADLILKSMDMDLQEWLGADAEVLKDLLKAYRHAEANAAKQRVKHHASEFKKTKKGKLGKDKFASLVAETEKSPIGLKNFRHKYVKYWYRKCPACKTYGVAAGDESWEDLADDQSDSVPGYQVMIRGYDPSEFYCQTCELSLVGDIAVNAVGINDPYVEIDEELVQYEPDYGND